MKANSYIILILAVALVAVSARLAQVSTQRDELKARVEGTAGQTQDSVAPKVRKQIQAIPDTIAMPAAKPSTGPRTARRSAPAVNPTPSGTEPSNSVAEPVPALPHPLPGEAPSAAPATQANPTTPATLGE